MHLSRGVNHHSHLPIIPSFLVLKAWLLWKLSSASYKNMGSSVMEGGGEEGEEGAI